VDCIVGGLSPALSFEIALEAFPGLSLWGLGVQFKFSAIEIAVRSFAVHQSVSAVVSVYIQGLAEPILAEIWSGCDWF
jgi:hypothetical protein